MSIPVRIRAALLLIPRIAVTALLAIAIGDMIFGVFMRYIVTGITDWLDVDPFNFFWVEEVGEYSLAWLTMIGAGVGIADRAHFTLHLVTHRFSPAVQRAMHIVTYLMIAGFGALAGWYGLKLAIVNSKLTSPALELNLAWVYAAPAVGGVLILLYGLLMLFEPEPVLDAAGLDAPGTAAAGDD